jgi:Flp pilus assembly protein TadG
MGQRGFSNKEAGSTMAEFAILASLLFTMMFGIIEFGRLMYTHSALTDAARRGARYAVLHTEADKACAKNVVVYGSHVDGACNPTGAALIADLTTANVEVVYEGVDDDNNPATPPTAYGTQKGTATVTIHDYTFTLSIPFARQTLAMPAYTTTLTAESAGVVPSPSP